MRRMLKPLLASAAVLANPVSAAPDDTALKMLVDKSQFSGSVGISYELAPDVTSDVTLSIGRKKLGKSDKGYASTHWRWASVSKQVIAVLVLQEVGKGAIALDQPLSRYLPEFSSANASKITVRQLLRHQSGLPNPDDTAATASGIAAYYLPVSPHNRDPVKGFCAGPIKGEPGGNWAYNNCDYIVAGALLEAVTGKSWQELVQERIARPFGLRSLQAFPSKSLNRGGTIGGQLEPAIDLASYGAAGALLGSARDMLAFDRALMTGKLLPPEELDQLWDGQADLGYIALGQWVFNAPLKDCATPVKLVERRGSIGGVQVRNFMAPESRTAIVIFSDKSEADFSFGEIWQGSGFSHDVLNIALCSKTPESK